MKQITLLITLLLSLTPAFAQRSLIYDTTHFRSLQLIVDEDELLPPIVDMAKPWSISIGFDEMSHDYRRLRYHIVHCEADWTESDGIFESDYLAGLNDQLIEDYEKSFNTMQIYTHYELSLPNEDVHLLLSGNYRVTIYDEDDEDNEEPLLKAEFCIVDRKVNLSASVTDNTDIDFQQQHQQVSISLGYGALRITDPQRELKTFVTQNRRPDLMVQVQPNMQNSNGAEFNHQRALIFPGGNECHRFNLLDVQHVNLGVDNIRWFDPYYHATLYEELPTRHYALEQDLNGAFMMRNSSGEDNETTSEYVFIHFRLKTAPLPGGPVYVHGNWVNDWPSDTYKMEYNKEEGEYQCAVLLKQGYYDYRFLQLTGTDTPLGHPAATSANTDGNFYQTQNEYQVLVYYREPGGRYDKLVGFSTIKEK